MASPRRIARLMFLAALCIAATTQLASASHHAYGRLTWQRLPHSAPGQIKIRLNYEVGYRLSYPGFSGLVVGATIPTQDSPRLLIAPANALAYNLDGPLVVTSMSTVDNLLVGAGFVEMILAEQAFPLVAGFQDCCRLGDLREGNDETSRRFQTTIEPLRADRSPVVVPVPRIYLKKDTAVTIPIPALVPEASQADVRFSTPDESGLSTVAPIGCSIGDLGCAGTNAMALMPQGLASWTPREVGKYGVQFTVTIRADGGLTSTAVLDTVFEVTTDCNPASSECLLRPQFTSAPPSVRVKAGETLSVPFTAAGNQSNATTTLSPLWIPTGAEFIQTSPPGTAVSGELRWTPALADAGLHFACVQARNAAGQANFGLHCATIEVWRDFVVTFDSPPPFSLTAPVPSQTLAPGEFAVPPADPTTTQAGFYFVGWTLDPNGSPSSALFLFSLWPVPRDLTLYAAWTGQQRTVTFESNGGTPVPARTVALSTTIAAPPPPTRGNDAFAGWYTDAGLTMPFQFGYDRIYSNTTLYAKWTPWVTLSFYSVGALIGSSSGLAPHLPGIITPVPRDGFEFGGWYLDTAFTAPFNLGTPILVHTSVYARWNALHVPLVFTGFFAPVDNLPVLNVGKAGRTIPIKWRLARADGTPVTTLTSFVVLTESVIACDASPNSVLEEQLAESTGGGIRYDAEADQFIYNWKTQKGVTGCRLISVTLDDGSRYSAKFKLQ